MYPIGWTVYDQGFLSKNFQSLSEGGDGLGQKFHWTQKNLLRQKSTHFGGGGVKHRIKLSDTVFKPEYSQNLCKLCDLNIFGDKSKWGRGGETTLVQMMGDPSSPPREKIKPFMMKVVEFVNV